MQRAEMVAIAARNRDAWADELRYRLVEVIFQDADNWMAYSEDAFIDSTDEEWMEIIRMMEESIQLDLSKVMDIL